MANVSRPQRRADCVTKVILTLKRRVFLYNYSGLVGLKNSSLDVSKAISPPSGADSEPALPSPS